MPWCRDHHVAQVFQAISGLESHQLISSHAKEATMAPTSLPILSLTSPTLPTELYHACKDHGFFYLVDHGIPTTTLNSVLDLARSFFIDATPEQKAKVLRKGVEEGGDGARGYQRIGENVTKGARDWHEAIDFYRDWDEGRRNGHSSSKTSEQELLQGPNLWPHHPPELQSVYQDYIESVKDVGTKVVRAMGEALGLEGDEKDILVKSTRNSFWVMRMIGYPPLENGTAEGVSCGEHTGTPHCWQKQTLPRLINSCNRLRLRNTPPLRLHPKRATSPA
jgi:isopenicillin N synthase-like dioxygenase